MANCIQCNAPGTTAQSILRFHRKCQLVKASGEPLRALHELENSVKFLGLFNENVLDLTMDVDTDMMKAKVTANGDYTLSRRTLTNNWSDTKCYVADGWMNRTDSIQKQYPMF